MHLRWINRLCKHRWSVHKQKHMMCQKTRRGWSGNAQKTYLAHYLSRFLFPRTLLSLGSFYILNIYKKKWDRYQMSNSSKVSFFLLFPSPWSFVHEVCAAWSSQATSGEAEQIWCQGGDDTWPNTSQHFGIKKQNAGRVRRVQERREKVLGNVPLKLLWQNMENAVLRLSHS